MLELLTAEIYEGLFDANSKDTVPSNDQQSSNDQQPTDGQDQADGQDQPDAKYDNIKKYVLYNKLKSLSQNLENFRNVTPDTTLYDNLEPIIYSIHVILKFYDLFDYDTIKKISVDVITNTDNVLKNSKSKKINKEEVIHAEL